MDFIEYTMGIKAINGQIKYKLVSKLAVYNSDAVKYLNKPFII